MNINQSVTPVGGKRFIITGPAFHSISSINNIADFRYKRSEFVNTSQCKREFYQDKAK